MSVLCWWYLRLHNNNKVMYALQYFYATMLYLSPTKCLYCMYNNRSWSILPYLPTKYSIFITKIHVLPVSKQDQTVSLVQQHLVLIRHATTVKTSFTSKTTIAIHVLPVVLCVPVWLFVQAVSTQPTLSTTIYVLLAVNSFPTVFNVPVQQHAFSVLTIRSSTRQEVRFYHKQSRMFIVFSHSVSWSCQPTLYVLCCSLLFLSQQWWLSDM